MDDDYNFKMHVMVNEEEEILNVKYELEERK